MKDESRPETSRDSALIHPSSFILHPSKRVVAGSRLHFGLLALAGPRRFGGVGLMINAPRLVVRAEPADEWVATGRALEFARHFDAPHRITVEEAPPEHCGFGTGTQLALAVGRAVSDLPLAEVVARTRRGKRSAIGVNGFERGGLLVDGGRKDGVAPLLFRHDFPEEWRVVVALPDAAPGLSGGGEAGAFAALAGDPARTDALCRLTLLGLLPALTERDLGAFAAALGEFNAKSGELFAPVQGGAYSAGPVSDLIARVRSSGVEGVGQSSWGPAVFAVADADRAAWLYGRLAGEVGRAWLTAARNVGAEVTRG
ncbi:MAG: beta-ribofuranosylaminobenzene 5'-phosphate synthase family protein [Gemmataceae bacterium]